MAKRPVTEASNNKAERSILFAVLFHLYIKLTARLPHCHLKAAGDGYEKLSCRSNRLRSGGAPIVQNFSLKTIYMCFLMLK
jgi:hypothetical protein